MQQISYEEIIKIQNKGLVTIPKRIREGMFEENGLAKIKREKGRVILEPVRTYPYPVRSYTDEELEEFFALDEKETKELKAKKLI